MGQYVRIKVLKDKGGVYGPAGHYRVISKDSTVMDTGYINVYDDLDVNVRNNPPKVLTLLLVTPDNERIYTDLTKAEWMALVVAANTGPSGNTVTFTKKYVIATAGPFPPGPDIVDEDLYNGTLHVVAVGTQLLDDPEDIYDPLYSGTEGRLRLGDLPAGGIELVDGDIVRVTIELPL